MLPLQETNWPGTRQATTGCDLRGKFGTCFRAATEKSRRCLISHDEDIAADCSDPLLFVSTYPFTGSVEQEHTLATLLLVNFAIRIRALFEVPAIGEDTIGGDIAISNEAGALALADV